ncbi:putative isomerase YbhE [Ascobolus immersus RN42]|uniref:Putative isomerase YbhE n=1 Tax=Ascobolus immersus RN42 TaxID=1160509 RepID=A0A3N4HI48_ASCIM|nr:putative isomerase YbhE [Ascobolus immersus RN42]
MTLCDAKTLFVGGNNRGVISTYSFDPSTNQLTKVHDYSGGLNHPSWQSLSRDKKILITADEGPWNQNGAFATLRINADKSLTQLSKVTVKGSGVSVTEGNNGFFGIAHYDTSSVTTGRFDTQSGAISLGQVYTYNSPTGPSKPRQNVPHPHQALVDPTGRIMTVPDLGADQVRIYDVGNNGSIQELSPLQVTAAYGPRHGMFWPNTPGTQAKNYYLVNELSNKVIAYKVNYNNNIPTFTATQTLDTLATKTAPVKYPAPTAAEIAITADGKFAYISNRADESFGSKQDSIGVFSIAEDGSLTGLSLEIAGGDAPRHISTDPTGEFLAVALNWSNKFIIYKRDSTGKYTKVAESQFTVPECVTWFD